MNRTTQALLTLTATLAVGSANAALTTASFGDASFENGGSVDNTAPNANYQTGGGIDTWSALDNRTAGAWITRSQQSGSLTGGARQRNGLLVKSNDYVVGGGTETVPAGVDGSQFMSMSRADNQMRSWAQYVDTGLSGTTGDVTISIDYWVHELGGDGAVTGNAAGGSAFVAFQVFGFNDPALVGHQFSSGTSAPNDAGDQMIRLWDGAAWQLATDPSVAGVDFVSSGGAFVEYLPTTTSAGFQTLTETISLGATSYQYIGIAIGTYGDDGRGTVGETVSFDNLQVVPEPGSLALLGLGGLLIARRRR